MSKLVNVDKLKEKFAVAKAAYHKGVEEWGEEMDYLSSTSMYLRGIDNVFEILDFILNELPDEECAGLPCDEQLLSFYRELVDDRDLWTVITAAKEHLSERTRLDMRGIIAGETLVIEMLMNKIKVGGSKKKRELDDIIGNLELIKADIEWDKDMTYQVWIDEAIDRLKGVG